MFFTEMHGNPATIDKAFMCTCRALGLNIMLFPHRYGCICSLHLKTSIYSVCVCLNVCLCRHHTRAGVCGSRKWRQVALELESWVVVSHRLGAGNQIWVPLQGQVLFIAQSSLQPPLFAYLLRGENLSQDTHVKVRGQEVKGQAFYLASPNC